MSGSTNNIIHGTSALALAYLFVLVGILTAFIQSRANFGKLLVSPLLAIPVQLVAGLLLIIVGPVMEAVGIGPESTLMEVFVLSVFATVGYGVGRYLASHPSPADPIHKRGAVVRLAEFVTTVINHARGNRTDGSIPLAGIPV